MNSKKLKEAGLKTLNALKRSILILISVLLLIALFINAVPKEFYNKIFTQNQIMDSVIGAVFGSIAAGNPLNSYIIGGELLDQGVGLVAVAAFILSWVTVGVVQLPAESLMLGRKFAFYRNIVAFISAIVISVLTMVTLSLF